MIISFYDRHFNALQNNASLVIDNKSYSLIRRGVDLDQLKCTCEPFTENIQPTFMVVKNDLGNYVYGCLAGIPERTTERKTIINGTDLKSMLKSDVLMVLGAGLTVNAIFDTTFAHWNAQVNQGGFSAEMQYNSNVGTISTGHLTHAGQEGVFNVWEDIFAPYLKYYGLFMTARIDLVAKKVIFTIGKSMYRELNVKLWEHGLYDYGKWVANLNETQGIVFRKDVETYVNGYKWILRADNTITTSTGARNIYPVKRKIVLKEAANAGEETEKLNEANTEALKSLCGAMFGENIELPNIQADFETKFNIYPRKGEGLYKSLPCGELHYDANGLKKVQIGYRFTGIQFIL